MRRAATSALVVIVAGLISVHAVLGARVAQNLSSPAPTFNSQVAAVLFANCSTCHRPGGIGPFSVLTYEDARPWARAIKAKVLAREMPPWGADPQFGEFRNSRALTSIQIETIVSWVDGGAPEGTGTLPAAPAIADTGWRMNRPPDKVLDLPFTEFQLPATGEVPAFTVWIPPLRDETFVQAIEIRPSISGVVHHSSLSLGRMLRGTRIGRAQAFPNGPVLDGVAVFGDGRPFWSPGGEHIAEKPVLFYVPGGGFLQFADGLAKRFGRDDYISWGLHLISRGKAETLRMQVGLWYAKRDPRREVKTWTVTQTLLADGREIPTDDSGDRQFPKRLFPKIPAGAANWPMTGIRKLAQDITIYSLWPHMHYRGKDMTFVLTHPNGRNETLLSVPRYDPHWQITYELAKPLKVRHGSTITAYGHFDNSAANRQNPDPLADVEFGPRGIDEMFLPFLEVSVDDEDLRLEHFQVPTFEPFHRPQQ